MKSKRTKPLMLIAIFIFFSFILNAQELYVGANYHPSTWSIQMAMFNTRTIAIWMMYSGNFIIAPYEPEFIEIK